MAEQLDNRGNDAEKIKGRIFDIERYATEDGPGIRTVVFFKGCMLRCKWCSNPESQRMNKEVMHYALKCVGCGKCIQNCPEGAISRSEQYGLVTDQAKCTGCGQCAKNCFYSARKVSGDDVTAAEVMETVLKDKLFYKNSGGGITLSGGEPLLQPAFARALLELSRREGLHTAMETCGMPCDRLAELMPLLNLLMMDLKHVNLEKSKEQLGVDYAPALECLCMASEKHGNVVIRIPCIPGFNHSAEDMKEIFTFAATLHKGVKRLELLPYHRLGREKYLCLGQSYAMGETEQLTPEELMPYADMGRKMGVNVVVGAQ
jgi:pyruvate formate lyase activating enzyme